MRGAQHGQEFWSPIWRSTWQALTGCNALFTTIVGSFIGAERCTIKVRRMPCPWVRGAGIEETAIMVGSGIGSIMKRGAVLLIA